MSRLWRVCTLSRRVFDEMTNKTPILFPLLLIVGLSLIFWLFSTIVSTLQALYLFGGQAGFSEIRLGNNILIETGSSQEDGVISLPLPQVLVGVFLGTFEVFYKVGLRLILLGTYFFVVGRLLRMDTRYGNWFGFTCWTYLPMVIVPATTPILMSFSLGSTASNFLLSLLSYLVVLLPMIWSVSITVQGLRSWTAKTTAACIGIASVPYVVIFLLYAPSILQSLKLLNFSFFG